MKLDLFQKKIDKAKLKKVFNQKTFLAVTGLACVVVVEVYVLVYLPYIDKTKAVEASNRERNAQLDILETYYFNISTYQNDMEQLEDEIADIMQQYPVETREEDILMLAKRLQNQNEISFDAISMMDAESVYTVSGDVAQMAQAGGTVQNLNFVKKGATYVNSTSYKGLKSCISDILASKERIAIDNIVYVKNESTGVLDGNIDLLFYSLAGTGKEYVAPEMSDYASGTENIFQNNTKVEQEKQSDTQAEENDAEATAE